MKARRLVTTWVPVLAWMLLIFFGSSDAFSAEHTSRFLVPFLRWLDPQMSVADIAAIHVTLRKLGHFIEYAILAALLWRGLRGTWANLGVTFLATAAFLDAAVFAASDEFHQAYVPTRTSSGHDIMIDCLGALTAVLLCGLLWRSRREKGSGLQPAD